MAKVSIPKISDAIAESLERRILEGSLKPGDRLQPERELALELGVSRPSLREAIQKLASKGLLQSRQGGGTYVTNRLNATFYDPWQEMLGAHPNAREDLLDFRRMLEGQAAEWAAERATDADVERLAQAYEALNHEFPGDDRTEQATHDMAFHQAIAEASHNLLIGHLTQTMLKLMEDNIRLNLTELGTVSRAATLLRDQHTQLFEAIRDRKPAAARAAAETHIDFVRATLAQSIRLASRRETAERRLSGDFAAAAHSAMSAHSSTP